MPSTIYFGFSQSDTQTDFRAQTTTAPQKIQKQVPKIVKHKCLRAALALCRIAMRYQRRCRTATR